MYKPAGWLLAAVFFLLGGIHAYWGLGGRWAMYIFEGVANPTILECWLVALALFAAMLVVLGRMGVWGGAIPQWIFRWGTGVLSAVFLSRGVAGYLGWPMVVTPRPVYEFWDTWLFSPLCLLISAGCVFLLRLPAKKY
ncbi:MAG TPA: hypothetical protein DEF36_03455 [Desulfotomaculum sp.]|nr:hypothetical protein [Desulfotomaculum sp.]